MDSDDNSSVGSLQEHDEESSPPPVEPSRSQYTCRAADERPAACSEQRDPGCRPSMSTLASEKDPRRRHSMRSSSSRRPPYCGSYTSRATTPSSGASNSAQLPPAHALQEDDGTGSSTMDGDCDKFGNRRISSGFHSRKSSHGSTCTAQSASSDSTVDYTEPQPGAYYVERTSRPVNLVVPFGNALVQMNETNRGGLIEATLVDPSPKLVIPVVEAAPLDESSIKKVNVFSCRSILCLVVAVGLLVVPLATGLVISMRNGSRQKERTKIIAVAWQWHFHRRSTYLAYIYTDSSSFK